MSDLKTQKKLTIVALMASAFSLLMVVMFVNPTPAPADFAVKDPDYQIVSALVQNGSEGLYILDQRTGLVAVFIYNPSKRALDVKGCNPIANAFGAAGR